jgi:2-polyprenyl-6-methoxyphenol hydroxylase-like FAD-dependent oxidoreductase
VPRGEREEEGDIDIVLFGDARAGAHDGRRSGWFWVIPFKDGRTSVGAVVSRAWIKEQRAELSGEGDASSLFSRAVAQSSTLTEMLSRATMIWDAPRAAADFSYRVRDTAGPGWLAIGDAGGFIDPLFSSGAHIAMVGAKGAADVIADANAEPEASSLEAWAERLRAGTETFVLAVKAFYAGPLVDYLFADNKHTALRRSVTSLLAGDVFTDAVWLRDARRRLAEMAQVSF